MVTAAASLTLQLVLCVAVSLTAVPPSSGRRELDADRVRSDLYEANWKFCVQ